ncbi:MAG: BatA domain-containing protein [Alphaproteobacteria bacterium]
MADRRVEQGVVRSLVRADREETPARTPWWLLLLRLAVAALVILALAHPILNPQARLAGNGPLLVVVDDGWAAGAPAG